MSATYERAHAVYGKKPLSPRAKVSLAAKPVEAPTAGKVAQKLSVFEICRAATCLRLAIDYRTHGRAAKHPEMRKLHFGLMRQCALAWRRWSGR
jgi:hypothetical protein